MFQDDFLMRQLHAFTAGVVRRLAGQEGDREDLGAVGRAVGIDVDMAARMTPDGLVSLMTTQGGAAGPRSLLLAMGLTERSRQLLEEGRPDEAVRAARGASALLRACRRDSPELWDAQAEVAQSFVAAVVGEEGDEGTP